MSIGSSLTVISENVDKKKNARMIKRRENPDEIEVNQMKLKYE
ncbi:hypothetical protein [Neobacillus niacini]|nr:hypothetical protein [Neobacillus niacini]MDR6999761.1 hypothetical protein [Neobacillus niacini]